MSAYTTSARPDRSPTVPTSILVVDDHRTFADLLEVALGAEADLECVGIATNVAQALSMTEALLPEVVVMDVQLGDGDGIAATAELTKRFRNLRVIVLSAFVNTEIVQRAAKAGACALLPKDGTLAEMLQAVRTAPRGQFMVHPRLLTDIAGSGLPPSAPIAVLTPREQQVLQMLGSGAGAHTIARELGISVATCRGHVKNVLVKLGAHSQLEAVVIAMQRRLIQVGNTDLS
jgi:DNA-binding NarL/FixJ family response regulator